MGNHEFCTECHENDFHIGQPCNPEKLAKVRAGKRKAQIREKTAIERLKKIQRNLKIKGIKSDFDEYNNLRISKWDV